MVVARRVENLDLVLSVFVAKLISGKLEGFWIYYTLPQRVRSGVFVGLSSGSLRDYDYFEL